ncbi:MAG: acyltransferase [Marinobacter sp.]|uniref:acyltransferase family protein n=1 Tax=Marinobacter sp. TaxID=50741 RepID=UPI0034A0AD62
MFDPINQQPDTSFHAQKAVNLSGQRFVFIDGLRAFAALAVVLFHFYDAVAQTAGSWAWHWIDTLFSYGYLGVDVFFVLSGFVISFSIRNGDFSLRYFARFGLRRSIRLDPAYWVTILIEIALIYIGLALFPSLDTPVPDLPTIISHLFYAQDLLGYGNIVSIFWTLCYEFQFYIVLVGTLMLASYARRLILYTQAVNTILVIAGFSAFTWSLAIFFGAAENPTTGLFINRWWQFFIGCLLTLHILGKTPVWCFFSAMGMLLIAIFLDVNSGADNGLATFFVICTVYAAAQTKGMDNWLSGAVPQFLGTLSYSIYLLHAVIGWRFIKLLHELNGADFSPWQAWIALVAGVSISVFSAWIMYKFIEAPSHRFSKTITLPQTLNYRMGSPSSPNA